MPTPLAAREPFTKPQNAKRQEALDLVAAKRKVGGPEASNVVPCGVFFQVAVQLPTPG